MIIQRKVEMAGVPRFSYWEDIIHDADDIDISDFLKARDDCIGTKYRIIHTAGIDIKYATITQPLVPEKEIQWSESE